MSSHHPFSPSTLPTLLSCSGRFLLGVEKEDSDSSAALAGTLTHGASHYCLETGTLSAHALVGMSECAFVGIDDHGNRRTVVYDFSDFDDDLAALADDYIEYARSLPGTRSTEIRLDLNWYIPGCWGTADAVFVHFYRDPATGLTRRVLIILDAKFGRIRVSAVKNAQLGAYALGMINRAGAFDEIQLHICQPKIRNYSVWTVEPGWLDELAQKMWLLFWDVRFGLCNFNPGYAQCGYCPAAGVCPSLDNYVLGLLVDPDSWVWLWSELEFSDVDKLSIEDLEDRFQQLDLIDAWAGKVRSALYKRALDGGELRLHKFVESTGKRRWRDKAEAAQKLLELGASKSEIYAQRLIGIGDAEKILAVGGRTLSEDQLRKKNELLTVIEKPEKKLVLVSLDDDRPAVSPQNSLDSAFGMFDELFSNDAFDACDNPKWW